MPTVQGDETGERAPFRIGQDRATATVVRRFNKDQLDNYLAEYFNPVYVPNMGMQIRKFKTHPDYNWLVLTDVEIDYDDPRTPPQSGTANQPEGGWKATETYTGHVIQGGALPASNPIYQMIPTNSWIEHTWTGASQAIGIPGSVGTWVNDSGTEIGDAIPPDADMMQVMSVLQHTVTWYNISTYPEANVLALLGKINNGNSYTTNGFTWRINRVFPCYNIATEGGTLLFTNYEPVWYYTNDGFLRCNVTYHFLEQIKTQIVSGITTYYGWNRYPKYGSVPVWQPAKTKRTDTGDSRYVYESGNFESLFVASTVPLSAP